MTPETSKSALAKRSPVTTHILDLDSGKPVSGVKVALELQSGKGSWKSIASGTTNADGRIEDLIKLNVEISPGIYRMKFEVREFHKNDGFYPWIEIIFEIKKGAVHTHVPLLLNRFGYTTYRGS